MKPFTLAFDAYCSKAEGIPFSDDMRPEINGLLLIE